MFVWWPLIVPLRYGAIKLELSELILMVAAIKKKKKEKKEKNSE